MELTHAVSGNTLKGHIKGKFTFTDNVSFRAMLDMLDKEKITSVVLDFSETTFVDSAALGMLLLMREEAKKRDIAVSLANANGQPQKMFVLSRFEELFGQI